MRTTSRASSVPSTPQRSSSSSPKPGEPGEIPARSRSSCTSIPYFTNPARDPSTRNLGPSRAATELTHRCERAPSVGPSVGPPVWVSAMNVSSSEATPSRLTSLSQ